MQANCSVNWPLPMAAAIETDPITQQLKLTKDFEVHAANYVNWSVESSILQIFPEIVGLMRIVDEVEDVMGY